MRTRLLPVQPWLGRVLLGGCAKAIERLSPAGQERVAWSPAPSAAVAAAACGNFGRRVRAER